MSIVTDSSGERPEHVYAIHKLFKSESELAALYDANKGNYKALKEQLAVDIEEILSPMRARYDAITEHEVKDILATGATQAREVASKKMEEVRKKIGVTL
jgi:tryptophanyl-tRNA synthetase